MRKTAAVILLILQLFLSGCGTSRKIENAAVIENIAVAKQGEKLVYTFYRLSDSDKPKGTEITAKSLENAVELASSKYIPDMTLAKLELLMIDYDISSERLKSDIEYLSAQSAISPVAYVTLCDDGALEKVKSDNEAVSIIENQIILCKNNNPEANINYLSVFNSFEDASCLNFTVPLITDDGELKISTRQIPK